MVFREKPWIGVFLKTVFIIALRDEPFASPGLLQRFAPGFTPGKVFSVGDVDQVSLFNGGLSIQIPLGQSFPVDGGLGYGIGLRYSSSQWDSHTYAPCEECFPSEAEVEFTPKLFR